MKFTINVKIYSKNNPDFMARKKNPEIERQAIKIFKSHGGILRYKDILKLGIHPRTLYALKNAGIIEQLQRGLLYD